MFICDIKITWWLPYISKRPISIMLTIPSFMLFSVLLIRECLSVRFEYLGIPGAVLRGQNIWLDCGYKLDDDDILYSVKWYKDNYEFYRYLPGERPPSQKYDLKGVYANLRMSNSSHAFLEQIDLDTEGTYACEVSTGPSFRTVRAEKDLFVYVMPETDPVIVGVLNRYPVGDEVNVSCSFGPSKPPAELTWYINGEKVKGEEVSSSYMSEQRWKSSDTDDGIKSVVSRLQFIVDPNRLWKGTLNLQCTASLEQIFYRSSEEIVVGDGTSGAEFNRVSQVPPGLEGPTIMGNLPRYVSGDLVDINCTSARSSYTADLQWKINDEEANPEYVVKHRPVIYVDGKVSTKRGLRFRVGEEHIKTGEEMRLKCVATMSEVIELSTVETVFAGSHKSFGFYGFSGGNNGNHQRSGIRYISTILFPCLTLFVSR